MSGITLTKRVAAERGLIDARCMSDTKLDEDIWQAFERVLAEHPDATHFPNVHHWFGLSYAQYLTIPRSVLQSMPGEWQRTFAACLAELDRTIDWRPSEGRYWVRLKDDRGRYVHDPLMDYERGRRRIPHRTDK